MFLRRLLIPSFLLLALLAPMPVQTLPFLLEIGSGRQMELQNRRLQDGQHLAADPFVQALARQALTQGRGIVNDAAGTTVA